MLRRALVAFLVLAFSVLSACSHQAPPEDVDKAGALFFERLKSAQYDAIYNDCAKSFKANKSRATIEDNLKQIVALGSIQDYQRVSTQFRDMDNRHTAWPVYAVMTDQTKMEITLTFVDDSGDWKLLGFEVKRRGS
jgi:hypothetical protein